MRVYIQWAQATPEDWTSVDINSPGDVRKLARKPVPGSNPHIDDEPGWINALNCQGIVFAGYDHIAIEYLQGDVLAITGWEDDPEDFGNKFWATQWRLEVPQPDPRLDGRMNTVQRRTIWGTPEGASQFPNGVAVRPWEQFSPPPSAATLHGVWLSDDLFAQHRKALSRQPDWREWV